MPKESYFASQIRTDFINLGWFFHKLPDSIRSAETRFNPVKLFDAFILKNGMFVAIEFKMVKGSCFPFAQVRDSQIQSLVDIENAGGVSFLFLNHRWKGENSVIVWRINDFIYLKNFWELSGRKSIPLATYPELWTVLQRNHRHWSLEEIQREIEEDYGKRKYTD